MNIFYKTTVLLFLILQGCATNNFKFTPMSFDMAIGVMTSNLFEQISDKDAIFIINPFIDRDTGGVTVTTKEIAKLIKKKAYNINFVEMSSNNISKASYIITGVIQSNQYDKNSVKIPHFTVSITDIETKQIVAHSEAWISDKNLSSEGVGIYADTPIVIDDKNTKVITKTAQTNKNETIQKDYIDTLKVNAWLNEAEAFFDKNDFKTAYRLFKEVAARSDGQIMKTYQGLYKSSLALGEKRSGEEAMYKMLKIGLATGELTTKFYFSKNETTFMRGIIMATEYPMWIRQIAKNIEDSKKCFDIEGYTSKTGNSEFNDALSKRRALKIRELLISDARSIANKIKAYGFGANNCKKCTPDDRYMQDRRVEFKVVDCH